MQSSMPTPYLLTRLVKSALYKAPSVQAIGLEVQGPPTQIKKAELFAYLLACNDKSPVYSKEKPPIHPFFAAKLLSYVLINLLTHPKARINLLRMLHAGQSFTYHEPIFVGQIVTPTASISSIEPKSTGYLVNIATSLLDDKNEPLMSGVTTMFVKASRSRSAKKAFAPAFEDGEELYFQTYTHQPKLYAKASGDPNPIHTSYIAAKLAGLPKPIMHGMCTAAMTCTQLINRFADSDPTRLYSISLRFSKLAFPGDKFKIVARQEDKVIRFYVLDASSRPVITHGKAILR